MAPRKIRLSFDPADDYRLIGITTPMPDYRLVFRINRQIRWDLKRLGTFQVQGMQDMPWFFLYHFPIDEYTEYFLTGNARPTQWMAEPNLLIAKGAYRPETFQKILFDCRAIDDIFLVDDYTHLINGELINGDVVVTDARRKRTIDRITNILYDLELFMMDLSRRLRPVQPLVNPLNKREKTPIKL